MVQPEYKQYGSVVLKRGSCRDDEFVASCQICNMLKGNLIADTEEELRFMILKKRIDKGYSKG